MPPDRGVYVYPSDIHRPVLKDRSGGREPSLSVSTSHRGTVLSVQEVVAHTRVDALVGVPFFDLRPSLVADTKATILADLAAVVDDAAFTNGRQVAEFERAFGSFCGAQFAVGTGSGLDALRLALIAAGIEAGDEVIVPAMTFIATFEAVTQAGARPVVADISESDYCVDPEAAAAAVTHRTRYLLPVHLYGQMADTVALQSLCESAGLGLLEDACQAHGATRDGHRAGTAGLAQRHSASIPRKNLGAFGDAGAVLTNDERLAATVRGLREHGQYEKYRHLLEGLDRLASTRCRLWSSSRKLPLLDELERGASAARSLTTSKRSRGSEISACRRCRPAASRSGTCSSYAPRIRRASPAS